MIEDNYAEWWPDHIKNVFAAVGGVMRSNRLYPEDLLNLPRGDDAILPGHRVVVIHLSKADAGGGKPYIITIYGPVFAGRWAFGSGELERLALSGSGPL